MEAKKIDKQEGKDTKIFTFKTYDEYMQTFFPKAWEKKLLEDPDSRKVGENIVKLAEKKMKEVFSR